MSGGNRKKNKTKIAIFDLTGCEGCEFHLLSLNELLLDFLQGFEITHWRLLKQRERADFDIAFVEGAVTTQKQIDLLKKIRETSKIVVALGACAITGNIFAQLPGPKRKEMAKKIYDKDYRLKAKFVAPLSKFIKVDYNIPGCPPDIESFKRLTEKLVQKRIRSKIKQVSRPDYTAKIEGHGELKVNFKNKKTEFIAQESERLVEGLVLDKDFQQAPFFTSRICGICPIAHNVCSWSAVENALGLKPTGQTIALRKLLLCGQMIKSHILHLFFLVLPDYSGVKGSLELAKRYPAEFHLMLNLKRTADQILEAVAGSPAFPLNTGLAGFRKAPQKDRLLGLADSISEVIDEAEDLIRLFAGLRFPALGVQTKMATIAPFDNSYPLYPGGFSLALEEIVSRGSTAKTALLKNRPIKVGALARMNYFSERINPKAKKAFQKLEFDPANPFNNNLAQAIEILHFLEEADKLINQIVKRPPSSCLALPMEKVKIAASVVGRAYLEAPRGVLCHEVKINQQGKIAYYNIIPPTQINLASLQKEIQQLVKKQEQALADKAKEKQIEQLIRAFDPCITCAVH